MLSGGSSLHFVPIWPVIGALAFSPLLHIHLFTSCRYLSGSQKQAEYTIFTMYSVLMMGIHLVKVHVCNINRSPSTLSEGITFNNLFGKTVKKCNPVQVEGVEGGELKRQIIRFSDFNCGSIPFGI